MIFFIFFDEYIDNDSYICQWLSGATIPQSDIRIKNESVMLFL